MILPSKAALFLTSCLILILARSTTADDNYEGKLAKDTAYESDPPDADDNNKQPSPAVDKDPSYVDARPKKPANEDQMLVRLKQLLPDEGRMSELLEEEGPQLRVLQQGAQEVMKDLPEVQELLEMADRMVQDRPAMKRFLHRIFDGEKQQGRDAAMPAESAEPSSESLQVGKDKSAPNSGRKAVDQEDCDKKAKLIPTLFMKMQQEVHLMFNMVTWPDILLGINALLVDLGIAFLLIKKLVRRLKSKRAAKKAELAAAGGGAGSAEKAEEAGLVGGEKVRLEEVKDACFVDAEIAA